MSVTKHLILLITLTGCGLDRHRKYSTEQPQPPVFDDRLTPYYDEFIEDSQTYHADAMRNLHSLRVVSDIDMDSSTNKNTVGVCWTFIPPDSDPYYEVWVRESEAKAGNRLRYIVYHELGHCLLDREHTNDENPNLMNSHYPSYSNDTMNILWDVLVLKLFNEGENP